MSSKKVSFCPDWRAKTKIFDDPCTVNAREKQSIETGEYKMKNFFRPCGQPIMSKCHKKQTFVYPQVFGINQCNVDRDSKFRYVPLTNLGNVQQLNARPFVSSGYRGAGANNLHLKDLESDLIQGDFTQEKKGCKNTSEVYIDRWQYLPEYGNPQRVDRAVEPFLRTGVNTRDLTRQLSKEDYCHMLHRPMEKFGKIL